MTLRARFALLFSLVVILVFLGTGAGAVLLARSDAARVTRDDNLEAAAGTERLRVALLSQAAAARAFLISGDEANLAGYDTGLSDQARLVRGLAARDLTEGERTALEGVAGDAGRWRSEAIEPLIALRRSQGVGATADQYLAVGSFQLFETILEGLDTLGAQFAAAADVADAAADRARHDTTRLGVVVGALAVVLTAIATVAVRHWVTRPLEVLGAAVQGMQQRGDLDLPIPVVGPPEIAVLGSEIDQMRQRIANALDLTVRSQEGLAQNAAVLMSVRSRLESSTQLMPPGWSVSASLTPATGVVAGDCYDIGWVKPGKLGLVVVDVAGHGAESAVVALRTKELLRAAMRTYVDLGEGVRWANQQLDGLDPGMFVTAFVAILDTGTGLVEYVCAGHPPALLCQGDMVGELAPTGPIIGPFEAVWQCRRAEVAEGSTLVVYTDGLTEARDGNREEFGPVRLSELVCQGGDDAEAVVKRCLDGTAAFSAFRGQDDLTVVAVSRSHPNGYKPT